MNNLYVILFSNEPELIYLHRVKWFQEDAAGVFQGVLESKSQLVPLNKLLVIVPNTQRKWS